MPDIRCYLSGKRYCYASAVIIMIKRPPDRGAENLTKHEINPALSLSRRMIRPGKRSTPPRRHTD